MEKELQLKLTVRIFTQDDEKCFGPGIATLMERVETHHSLRAAALSMGMAYSKAWRIIRTAEEVFGCPLLSSTTGGKNGGGAVLTPQGKRILTAYQEYSADLNAYGKEKFAEAFAFFPEL